MKLCFTIYFLIALISALKLFQVSVAVGTI